MLNALEEQLPPTAHEMTIMPTIEYGGKRIYNPHLCVSWMGIQCCQMAGLLMLGNQFIPKCHGLHDLK